MAEFNVADVRRMPELLKRLSELERVEDADFVVIYCGPEGEGEVFAYASTPMDDARLLYLLERAKHGSLCKCMEDDDE